jgi:hypothetical protein
MAREFDDSEPRMMRFAELVTEDAVLASTDHTFGVDDAGRATFLRLPSE